MELISQHAKKIMEGCKERARDAGLSFQDESLEYIVTNRDLLQLSPKMMIPTLYDYWVQDVEVLKEQGRYELYPNNPYETVINTRPPISLLQRQQPGLAECDDILSCYRPYRFFQNNIFFRHTREYDFTGRALSDKRLFAKTAVGEGTLGGLYHRILAGRRQPGGLFRCPGRAGEDGIVRGRGDDRLLFRCLSPEEQKGDHPLCPGNRVV